jgi:hypothetical protein
MTQVTVDIKGYRQLSAEDQLLINRIKAHAEETRTLVTDVQHYISLSNEAHSQVTNPARWAAMAQSDLQIGFMELVRAVAQPTTF